MSLIIFIFLCKQDARKEDIEGFRTRGIIMRCGSEGGAGKIVVDSRQECLHYDVGAAGSHTSTPLDT